MTRGKLLMLWLLCVAVEPILSVMMLMQALFGSTARALEMAKAKDACGNALFGGRFGETLSTRTGNALVEGQRWARIAAPVIDAMFGKGHCAANANRQGE
jgi:hypothetical protein